MLIRRTSRAVAMIAMAVGTALPAQAATIAPISIMPLTDPPPPPPPPKPPKPPPSEKYDLDVSVSFRDFLSSQTVRVDATATAFVPALSTETLRTNFFGVMSTPLRLAGLREGRIDPGFIGDPQLGIGLKTTLDSPYLPYIRPSLTAEVSGPLSTYSPKRTDDGPKARLYLSVQPAAFDTGIGRLSTFIDLGVGTEYDLGTERTRVFGEFAFLGTCGIGLQFRAATPAYNCIFDRYELRYVANGIPEPQAWLLMAGGFGLAGASLRTRRRLARRRGPRHQRPVLIETRDDKRPNPNPCS